MTKVRSGWDLLTWSASFPMASHDGSSVPTQRVCLWLVESRAQVQAEKVSHLRRFKGSSVADCS